MHIVIELLPDTSPLEQRLLSLEQADEDRRATLQNIEATKNRSKSSYEKHVHPRTFHEGDLVLAYDQAHDKTGKGKFESMWQGPYIVQTCLGKGAYILADSEGHPFSNPRNGLYLKHFYP